MHSLYMITAGCLKQTAIPLTVDYLDHNFHLLSVRLRHLRRECQLARHLRSQILIGTFCGLNNVVDSGTGNNHIEVLEPFLPQLLGRIFKVFVGIKEKIQCIFVPKNSPNTGSRYPIL